jgi:hypothetical protein
MTEEIQSKVTDEHRAFIGRLSEPVSVTIREEDARRMREVLGDTDPRWAEGTGIAPPYVISMFQGGPRRGAMPMILPNAILTQQEWRFSRPFHIGEELKAIYQIIDIRERLGGRYGYSVLVTSTTDYYDQQDQHVAATLLTITQFDPAGARERA